MHHFGFLSSKCDFPAAASPESAALGIDRWLEAVGGPPDGPDAGGERLQYARKAAADPVGRRFLESIFGNSPFLTSLIIKDPDFTRRLLDGGPDDAFAGIIDGLARMRGRPRGESDIARALRVAKRQAALTVAIADISGAWPLDRVTGALSDFADAALGLAAAHVLTEAGGRDGAALKWPDDPERDSGLVIIGMGKLGARELNYSSDIDLIVLYDPDRIAAGDGADVQKRVVRMARDLVRLIEERTADGYVFRTDLRLRPDPGVTPVALSVLAAETYYESLGQNWERAAMIKARPVAGDKQAGADFLRQLTPFVWRKSLDFAAIQDIHSIKRQIHAHKGGSEVAVAGHNIKLGRGGIREIEFFAQTQQLIWGGRTVALRTAATCEALSALAAAGLCDRAVTDDMVAAYEFLRRLEHRLQMVNDEQTQTLPEAPAELEKVAVFMGFPSADDFADVLLGHLRTVQRHYGNLFDDAPSLSLDDDAESAGSLVFTGSEADPETLATITGLGYGNPEFVDAAVRGWHHGRYRATRSTRAREILTELMPVLLKAIGASAAPDVAFIRFDEFLSRLPAGVQLFSLFHSNPQLLDLMAEIMGKAPRLAEHLSRRPVILDSVLMRDFFDPPPDRETLLRELNDLIGRTDHFEQALDVSRRWNNDRRFQVGVQFLRGTIGAAAAGRAFSNIAETAIAGLYPVVVDDFARKHGHVPGAGLAVLALGKLGSREMTAASDLDLIFIYSTDGDGGDGDAESDGDRPLGRQQYFARLAQRLINALTAMTAEGLLYEVDMRLRPSGNKGPIASSFDGFAHYHAGAAWTWERMALTRARAILGPPELRDRISAEIKDIVTAPRDPDALLADVAEMRARLDSERHTECIWALKNLRGGLVDIEFIAQYLTLKNAHDDPGLIGRGTLGTLEALADAGFLDAAGGRDLMDALELWQGLQGLLALTIEGELTDDRVEEISSALKVNLVAVGGAADFADLEARIRATAARVHELFKELIEGPAAALPPSRDTR